MTGAFWPGWSSTIRRLEKLENIDPEEMLLEWSKIIIEDNRAGVLNATDKNGNLMTPVKYRTGKAIGTRFRSFKDSKFGTTKRAKTRRHKNMGNLVRKSYLRAKGPPLAPRGENSRVITNLAATVPINLGKGKWIAQCVWRDVFSTKGKPFLKAHFDGARTGRGGATKLPRRDLRGVRPIGKRKALIVLQRWVRYWEKTP